MNNTQKKKSEISICVIAPTMPPLTGGAETFAEVLTLSLAKAKYSVHLITAEEPREIVVEEIHKGGGSITILGTTFGSCDGYVGWEWAMFSRSEAIHKIISEKKIDIIHALSHDTILSASIALKGLDKINRPKLVITTCEMSTEDSHFGIARSKFVYQLPIDGLIQISQYYIDIARNHGCAANYSCVAAAVDVNLFLNGSTEKGRELLGLNEKQIVITCPSRFSPRKGQLDLLAAINILPQELKSKIVCLLAGSTNSASNDYLNKIKMQVEKVDFKCIITEIPRSNMPDILKVTDIVVLPSYKEGLGFSAIESMVAGCPVILNNVTGFDEIPDADDEVLFVPSKDIDILSEKISFLITNEKKRHELAEKGKKLALNKFSIESFTKKIEESYLKMLENV